MRSAIFFTCPALPKCQTKEYTLKRGVRSLASLFSQLRNAAPQTGKRDSAEISEEKRSRILNATSLSATLIGVHESDFEQVSNILLLPPQPWLFSGRFQAEFSSLIRHERGPDGENHLCSIRSSFARCVLVGLNPGLRFRRRGRLAQKKLDRRTLPVRLICTYGLYLSRHSCPTRIP